MQAKKRLNCEKFFVLTVYTGGRSSISVKRWKTRAAAERRAELIKARCSDVTSARVCVQTSPDIDIKKYI